MEPFALLLFLLLLMCGLMVLKFLKSNNTIIEEETENKVLPQIQRLVGCECHINLDERHIFYMGMKNQIKGTIVSTDNFFTEIEYKNKRSGINNIIINNNEIKSVIKLIENNPD